MHPRIAVAHEKFVISEFVSCVTIWSVSKSVIEVRVAHWTQANMVGSFQVLWQLLPTILSVNSYAQSAWEFSKKTELALIYQVSFQWVL